MDEYKEYQNIMANVKQIDSLGNSFTESTSTTKKKFSSISGLASA
jgi:hypothetical protein